MEKNKRKVGRPKMPGREKIVHARIPVRKEVYARLKANVVKNNKTFTEKIEDLLNLEESLENK